MDAISSCRILGLDHSLCSTTNTHINIKPSFWSLPCSQLLRPNVALRRADFALPRLRISNRRNTGVEQRFRAPRISCLSNDECKETESVSEDSQQEASIDLKLPRRSLLVTFTCDACGVRSQRLINRLAYERGLVYVQCSGCSQYHKLVDNLGLVIEYNLQEEIHSDANMDQV